MKKSAAVGLCLLFVFSFFPSCSKKSLAPAAGSAKAQDMLSLLPQDTRGVVVVDVQRIMATEMAQKAIKENKAPEKYEQFVQETGIDPQKDVYFFVLGLTGLAPAGNQEEGVAVVNLKYDRDKLLALVKAQLGELTETDYNGITVYQATPEEGKKPVSGAFLSDSNIIVGTDAAVKKVIDVSQRKAENIWKNVELSDLMKGSNKAAMVWGAFQVPAEAMQKAASANPMLGIFSDIKAVLLSFDYRDESLHAEIKALSPDEKKNKEMANALNGFKALGAGAASKNPQVGEVLNRIEITSSKDFVEISVDLPEDLIQSLQQTMKPQMGKEEKEN
jgi:hypothetical protein